jgi:hypothetical protein
VHVALVKERLVVQRQEVSAQFHRGDVTRV